ncbi:MAG TPA: Flp pilus assembly protein CpaB [Xanthobacteraceae bacterium]
MRRNNLVILILALVMGGAAALLAHDWLQSHARASTDGIGSATVVVATEALAFGTELTAANVTEIPWAAKNEPDGAFASKDELLREGRRVALAPFERGEPILRQKVTGAGQRASLSALLDGGKRAVTVRVDDVRGVAGFILPGDFVDVVLIGEGQAPRRENYSEILLQRVKVLAVDQLVSEQHDKPTVAKAVTIEVTPEQAQKLLLATNIGKLSLILRRPTEVASADGHRVTESDLDGLRERIARAAPPPAPVVVQAAAAPPPPPPSDTVKITIVRNLKGEDYTVPKSTH